VACDEQYSVSIFSLLYQNEKVEGVVVFVVREKVRKMKKLKNEKVSGEKTRVNKMKNVKNSFSLKALFFYYHPLYPPPYPPFARAVPPPRPRKGRKKSPSAHSPKKNK
jgi:hypothetical protein